MTTTATTATTTAAEAATTSAPEEPLRRRRPSAAAAAWSEQLYARHHRMVIGLCRALLRDPGEAEDAAQQTFLSAHRALLNGAEPREPPAWLATIARNECWARISGRMREPLATDAADEVAGTGDPVAEAIRRADLAALWRAIRTLPGPQREALLLREFGGLRYDELAAAIGVTEPAVESLLFRARTRLRAQLQTAYAAATGGAWLEPLARLLGGGAAPALATKAVAIGLGTAAVTGTAVVVPQVVEHNHRSTPAGSTLPVVPAVGQALRRSAPEAVAQAPVFRAALRTTPRMFVARAAPARPSRERRDAETRSHEASDARTPRTEAETHDGEHRTATTAATTTSHESGDGAPTSSHEGSDDEHGGLPVVTTVEAVTVTVADERQDASSSSDSSGD